MTGFATEGSCSACLLEAGLESASLEPVTEAEPARVVGDYEILAELARGGMGVVFKARQVSLARIVALKMILGGRFASEIEVRRFREEAQAAAALRHPHIVAIHEVGEIEGQPFFSMDFIDGPSLAEAVRVAPFDARRSATCVRGVAEAMQHAHERGILHRDLKPSNVLLDAAGCPHVTDFGLAKRLAGAELAMRDSDLTLSGQVLGSPSFMAPEHVTGRRGEPSPASDVYALGALLYHALTGRPPFLADSIPATLRLVAEAEPVSLRLLAPGVPADLDTICRKCLEKDPRRRYASAREVEEELGRFLCDQPIRARQVGRVERSWRWCRRHPALALVSGLAVVLFAAVVSLATVAVMQSEGARRMARERARSELLANARTLLATDLADRRFAALDLLQKAGAIRPDADLRNAAAAALSLPGFRVAHRWTNLSSLPVLDFDPEFDHYAHRTDDHVAVMVRIAEETRAGAAPGLGGPVDLVRYSPDGRWLAVGRGTPQRWLRIFDLTSGRFVYSERIEFDVLDFSGDSRRIGVVRVGGKTTVHELPTGRERLSIQLTPPPSGLRLNRDGAILAAFHSGSAEVRFHEGDSGRLLYTMTNSSRVLDAAWHPDGSTLVVGGDDGVVQLWDPSSRSAKRSLAPLAAAILQLAISHDGQRVASWGEDGYLRIRDLTTARELFRVAASSRFLGKFGRDDTRLSYRTPGGHLEMLEIAPGRERRTLSAGRGVTKCRFSDDGETLWGLGRDGVEGWAVEAGRPLAGDIPSKGAGAANSFEDAGGHPACSESTAFSVDLGLGASLHMGRVIRLLGPRGGAELVRLEADGGAQVAWLALDPDGSRLAVVTREGSLELWNLRLVRSELQKLGLGW